MNAVHASVFEMATGHGETPRRRRTIYHNDARHYYLWVFESDPLDLHDAHRPVDEVAGTGVTTFSYCVERSDGIFYPSRVPGSLQFGSDKGTPDNPHTSAITFHAWDSMRSLQERGLDPLKVLVDRAHEKDMEFWADLRLSTYGGMPEAFKLANGKNQLSFPRLSHGSELLAV